MMFVILKDGTHFESDAPMACAQVFIHGAAALDGGLTEIDRIADVFNFAHAPLCSLLESEPRGRVAVERGTPRDLALRVARALIPCPTCRDQSEPSR